MVTELVTTVEANQATDLTDWTMAKLEVEYDSSRSEDEETLPPHPPLLSQQSQSPPLPQMHPLMP